MPTNIPPEDLALLWPENLDLYYVWDWHLSVSENVAEVIRWFPGFSARRCALESLADSVLRDAGEPFNGEFYLHSGTEEEMTEAAMQARSLGVSYVIRRTDSGDKWEL